MAERDDKNLTRIRQANRVSQVAISALRKDMAEDSELDAGSPQVDLVCKDLERLIAVMDEVFAEGAAD